MITFGICFCCRIHSNIWSAVSLVIIINKRRYLTIFTDVTGLSFQLRGSYFAKITWLTISYGVLIIIIVVVWNREEYLLNLWWLVVALLLLFISLYRLASCVLGILLLFIDAIPSKNLLFLDDLHS